MAWKELNKRKWELQHKGQVLATIYEKTETRYSVYIAVPLIYERVRDILGKTYCFKTFDEAKEQCDKMLRDRVLKWAMAAVSYLNEAEAPVREPEKLEFGGQDCPH